MSQKLVFVAVMLVLVAASILSCSQPFTAVGTPTATPTPSGLAGSPAIDGTISPGEWKIAQTINLDCGKLMIQNDSSALYILIDLVSDTYDDPPLNGDPWGDHLNLCFDVNADRAITPGIDVEYGLYPGSHTLCISYAVSTQGWTHAMSTGGRLGAGFSPSANSSVLHRIWELSIPLSEIGAQEGKIVSLGLRLYSMTPRFTCVFPTGFSPFMNDFSNMLEVLITVPSSNETLVPPAVIVATIPKLLSPPDGATLDNGPAPTVWSFHWSEVPGATLYNLYVFHSGSLYPRINTTISSLSFDVSNKGSSIADTNRYGWTWKVRALVNGQYGAWSETWTFNVGPIKYN